MASSHNVRKLCILLRGLRGYSQFCVVSSSGVKQHPLLTSVPEHLTSRRGSGPTTAAAAAVPLPLFCSSATRPQSAAFYSTDSASLSPAVECAIEVQTVNGLLELSLPMLSRREKCRFTLQPFADTLGDFLERIRQEDRAIESVQARTEAGDLMATSTSIDIAMKQNFYLIINNTRYLIQGVASTDPVPSSRDASDDVRHLVASLYRTINSDLYLEAQRRHMLARQEKLRLQLEPMEKLRMELEKKAEQRTRFLSWVGLGLMGAQFGFMARLTWWEYSWDVMEPVTYFVGYATAIAAFGYYVITRQDYAYPDARDREFLITVHRNAGRLNFDLAKYNHLRTQLSHIERDLRRLRDPLDAHLSLPHLEQKKLEPDTSMPWDTTRAN